MQRSTLKTLFKALSVLGNIILLALIITLCIGFKTSEKGISEWRQETYTVSEGETLWDIGAEHCPENTNIGYWVHEVSKINDIQGGKIYPNQEIIILIP